MSQARDHAVQQVFASAPLLRYSVYTHIQCQCLDALRQELHQALDASLAPTSAAAGPLSIDAGHFNRAYGHFWLWVLGAYEVVRTMCQTPECFSEPFLNRLRQLKKLLATVRVPFAKQELAGSYDPVGTEPSVTGVRGPPADLVFRIRRRQCTVRQLTNRWQEVFDSINPADIVADRRTHYDERRR